MIDNRVPKANDFEVGVTADGEIITLDRYGETDFGAKHGGKAMMALLFVVPVVLALVGMAFIGTLTALSVLIVAIACLAYGLALLFLYMRWRFVVILISIFVGGTALMIGILELFEKMLLGF